MGITCRSRDDDLFDLASHASWENDSAMHEGRTECTTNRKPCSKPCAFGSILARVITLLQGMCNQVTQVEGIQILMLSQIILWWVTSVY